jgi:transposase
MKLEALIRLQSRHVPVRGVVLYDDTASLTVTASLDPVTCQVTDVRAVPGAFESKGFTKRQGWASLSALIRSEGGWAMPRAYSSDLRERLTAAVTAGISRNEAADVFSVAISTAVKWMQRLRDTGSSAAKSSGGSTSPLEQHTERILAIVRERPDAILKEIQAALRKDGIHTSKSALDRFLARHKITRKKKSLLAAEQKRKDVARARRKWIREQGLLDTTKLVFIDETSVNTSMVRLCGRAPCGVRLVDHVPFGPAT